MAEHTWVVFLVGEGPSEQLVELWTVTFVELLVIGKITRLQKLSS